MITEPHENGMEWSALSSQDNTNEWALNVNEDVRIPSVHEWHNQDQGAPVESHKDQGCAAYTQSLTSLFLTCSLPLMCC